MPDKPKSTSDTVNEIDEEIQAMRRKALELLEKADQMEKRSKEVLANANRDTSPLTEDNHGS